MQDAVKDTVTYGIDNIIQNGGGNIALSGIIVVFLGLILIAGTIWLFNKLLSEQPKTDKDPSETLTVVSAGKNNNQVPLDHLVAISATVELYRRLHYDVLESKVTFNRGEINPAWKAGARYGQRQSKR